MQTLIDNFIRPPNQNLNHFSPAIRTIGGQIVIRKDEKVSGIPVSVYSFKNKPHKGVIVYCHSLGSSKFEAETLLPCAVKAEMKLVAFSFQRVNTFKDQQQQATLDKKGVITFGFYEANQVSAIINWVQQQSSLPLIVWGRSMGAVAALRSQLMDPKADGVVLDSPYQSLKDAIVQVMTDHLKLPGFIVNSLYRLIQSTLEKSLGFQVQKLNLGVELDRSSTASVPCVFIGSKSDKLFGTATERLYVKYNGPKQLIFTPNRHSDPRDQSILAAAIQTIRSLVRLSQKQKFRRNRKMTGDVQGLHPSLKSSLTMAECSDSKMEQLRLDKIDCKKRHPQIESARDFTPNRWSLFCFQ